MTREETTRRIMELYERLTPAQQFKMLEIATFLVEPEHATEAIAREVIELAKQTGDEATIRTAERAAEEGRRKKAAALTVESKGHRLTDN